jgi:hypothetical protein
MNKKHVFLTPAEAIQRDLEADGTLWQSREWPTKINSVDSSIWY